MGYVVGSGTNLTQWGYINFNASGAAQTAPATGGVTPTLPAPALLNSGVASLTSADIVEGLQVRIVPNGPQGWSYQDGDRITVYFYLSGTYPLTDNTKGCPTIEGGIHNIATLQYTVANGDELTSGMDKILGPLPQWSLAGYGGGQNSASPGTLQMNLRVVRPGQGASQTYWSAATDVLPIDTATL
jgi:hypothetical protein